MFVAMVTLLMWEMGRKGEHPLNGKQGINSTLLCDDAPCNEERRRGIIAVLIWDVTLSIKS